MDLPETNVTSLLAAHASGDQQALGELFRVVYRELRALAHRQRLRLNAGGTFDSVALVSECYLKLARGDQAPANDRGHFFAVAACAMRHLLVDYARSRSRIKRDGGVQVELDPDELALDRQADTVLAVQQGLDKLAEVDPRLVAVVECRYFAGFSIQETAEALDLSDRTVRRCWQAARTVLGRELQSVAT